VFLAIFVIEGARIRTGNPLPFERLYEALGKYNVEILWTAPACIAAIRGRRHLKSILLGKLSIIGMFGTGLGVGCACVLFSSIIGLSYFYWPSYDPHGLADAFGALPVTAYLLGPFGEEMFYQVGLQTWLQRFGSILAVIGATIPFWGFHLYGGFVPMHDAVLFLLPSFIAYALVRQITKSFGSAVLAHSTYNVLISSLSYVPR
jgi:hypothetical protein